MKKINLSKLEGRIMDVFWNVDGSLSISDIQTYTPDLSVYSIRQVVHKLEKLGFVKVSGYGENKYSVMRLYAPIISQEDYLRDSLSSKSILSLTASFVQSSDDYESLEKLNKMLEERMNVLKSEGNKNQ